MLANRLPQPGVHYTACLVSLEGHGGDLPAVEPPRRTTSPGRPCIPKLRSTRPPFGKGRAKPFSRRDVQCGGGGGSGRDRPRRGRPAAAGPVTLVGAPRRGDQAAGDPADAWSAPALPGAVVTGQQAGSVVKGLVTGATSVTGLSVNPVFIDPGARLVEFTVLKHWSFTCGDGGDFESLVRGLDDGMLGTLPPPGPPPTTAGTPPGAPGTRPDPVVTDTGHVQTAAVSRRGDPGRAWYRGPFTPRQILRAQPDESGVLPLLHAADQARRVGPDGIEDLSLAAAFEIGRLLAVAQPAVVAGAARLAAGRLRTKRGSAASSTSPAACRRACCRSWTRTGRCSAPGSPRPCSARSAATARRGSVRSGRSASQLPTVGRRQPGRRRRPGVRHRPRAGVGGLVHRAGGGGARPGRSPPASCPPSSASSARPTSPAARAGLTARVTSLAAQARLLAGEGRSEGHADRKPTRSASRGSAKQYMVQPPGRAARAAARRGARLAGRAAADRGGAVPAPRGRRPAAAARVDPVLLPGPQLDRRARRGRAVGRRDHHRRPGAATGAVSRRSGTSSTRPSGWSGCRATRWARRARRTSSPAC